MENDLEDNIQQPVFVLEQIEHLLVAHGEQHWCCWITRDITALKKEAKIGHIARNARYGRKAWTDLPISYCTILVKVQRLSNIHQAVHYRLPSPPGKSWNRR